MTFNFIATVCCFWILTEKSLASSIEHQRSQGYTAPKPKTNYLNMTLSSAIISANGANKNVILINGKFLGNVFIYCFFTDVHLNLIELIIVQQGQTFAFLWVILWRLKLRTTLVINYL